MSTKPRTKNDSARTADELPGGWERVDEQNLRHGVREAFEHTHTGLRVTVESMSRPDQMHDARTSQMDSGYVARVRDDVGADLTHTMTTRQNAESAAEEFVQTYPDGEYEMPSDDERHAGGPINWRDN